MDIVLTGTGSQLPDPHRAGPSTLVKAGDTQILVDAGRGVAMRLAGAATSTITRRWSTRRRPHPASV